MTWLAGAGGQAGPRTGDGRASKDLDDADCIIFDCDGVLVDVSRSYYRAILLTTSRILADAPHLFGPAVPKAEDLASQRMIDRFKDTGMFNDEVDVTCALILAAALSSADGTGYGRAVDLVVEEAGAGGIESVISYVAGRAGGASELVRLLEHPSPDRGGMLCTVFDHMFYGSDLCEKVRGRRRHDASYSERGAIEHDRVIMTEQTMSVLSGRFGGRMAMVTGRGLASARHTLGGMLRWFDVGNSAFLEDEPRAHAKPNPMRLEQCIRNMGCRKAIYVGDSAEDAMMARTAESDVVFCGISGTSSDPKRRRDILAGGGASLVLDSVLDIPKALNLE